MVITLYTPKEVVLVAEQKKSITTLTIERVVDNPTQKFVRVFFKELNEPTTLWEGAAYDAAGQWSDSDVQARIAALFA